MKKNPGKRKKKKKKENKIMKIEGKKNTMCEFKNLENS